MHYFRLSILILSFLFCCIFNQTNASSDSLTLSMDVRNSAILPKYFRIPAILNGNPLIPDNLSVGVANLRISASSQFSEKSLQTLSKRIPSNKILIIDLREESHAFINGISVSWRDSHNAANQGKNIQEIESDEKARILDASSQSSLRLRTRTPREYETIVPLYVATEEMLVKASGMQYLRLPVTDFHRPNNEQVDQFVDLVLNQPPELWIHLHCRAGLGRTTTFLILFDMLHNAKQISLDDLFVRHALLGGFNLRLKYEESDWKYPLYMEKMQFLEKFYRYCRETDPSLQSWTQWSQTNP